MGRRALAHHTDRLRSVLARANRSADPIVQGDAPAVAGSAVQALAAAADAVQSLLDDAADRAEHVRRAQATTPPALRRP